MVKVSPESDLCVVGVGNVWDNTTAPRFTSEQGGRRNLLACSVRMTRNEEVFQIVSVSRGWATRYYTLSSQQGEFFPPPPEMSLVKVGKGNENVGHGKDFKIAGEKGKEVTIYFTPEQLLLSYKAGRFDGKFDPFPTSAIACPPEASTFFELKHTSLISMACLFACNPLAALVSFFAHLLPVLTIIFFAIWLGSGAERSYTSTAVYSGEWSEIAVIALVFIGIFIPKLIKLFEPVGRVLELTQFAIKARPKTTGTRLFAAVMLISLLNTVLQPVTALGASLYVALFLSEQILLNVILNAIVLEFVIDLDDAILSCFLSYWYPRSLVCVALTDINYLQHPENEFWYNSNSSRQEVLSALKRAPNELDSDTRWLLLTSCFNGLGVLGANEKGECVSSFGLDISIVDWSKLDDTDLHEKGALYLSCINDFSWRNIVSWKQRALLFKHFPETATGLPWVGTARLSSLGLTPLLHGRWVQSMLLKNNQLMELNLQHNWLGLEGVVAICEALAMNRNVAKLDFSGNSIGDAGASVVASMLRENSALQILWLYDQSITDVGACLLMEGIEENPLTCIKYAYMSSDASVSKECQEFIRTKSARINFEAGQQFLQMNLRDASD